MPKTHFLEMEGAFPSGKYQTISGIQRNKNLPKPFSCIKLCKVTSITTKCVDDVLYIGDRVLDSMADFIHISQINALPKPLARPGLWGNNYTTRPIIQTRFNHIQIQNILNCAINEV